MKIQYLRLELPHCHLNLCHLAKQKWWEIKNWISSEGETNPESPTMSSPPQLAYVRARPCTTQYLVSGAGWSAGFERPGNFLIFVGAILAKKDSDWQILLIYEKEITFLKKQNGTLLGASLSQMASFKFLNRCSQSYISDKSIWIAFCFQFIITGKSIQWWCKCYESLMYVGFVKTKCFVNLYVPDKSLHWCNFVHCFLQIRLQLPGIFSLESKKYSKLLQIGASYLQ